MYYKEKVREINSKLMEISGKTVVWPCGGHTVEMMLKTELSHYYDQLEFVDAAKCGSVFWGKRVLRVSEVNWDEVDTVIISTRVFQSHIEEELRSISDFCGKVITFYTNEKREFYRLYDNEHGISWGGEYSSWDEVEKICDNGFASENVMAVYAESKEQNCGPEYCFVSHILKQYIERGKVIIIDYGGALGSQYIRNKDFLDNACIEYEWCVVDLQAFVEYGRIHLEEDKLHFFSTLREIKEKYKAANYLIYARGSIQYISNIDEVMREIFTLSANEIIIDNTPMAEEEHFVLQNVKDYFYEAKFAVRVFSEPNLIETFEKMDYLVFENEIKSEMRFSDYNAWYKRLIFKLRDMNHENG